jgi:hypothetical protein
VLVLIHDYRVHGGHRWHLLNGRDVRAPALQQAVASESLALPLRL